MMLSISTHFGLSYKQVMFWQNSRNAQIKMAEILMEL